MTNSFGMQKRKYRWIMKIVKTAFSTGSQRKGATAQRKDFFASLRLCVKSGVIGLVAFSSRKKRGVNFQRVHEEPAWSYPHKLGVEHAL